MVLDLEPPPVAFRGDLDLFADFCSKLVLENGERMVLEPFQRVMLAEYFAGATETLIILPKKNGKTSLISALALFHLLVTVDAECVVGASSRDQAAILFNQAHGLIRRSPEIRDLFLVKTGFREIRSAQDRGRVRVLASDANTADGVIPTLAIVDELHRHRNGELYGVFRDGLGPRNGQLVTISTAGADLQSPLGVMRTAAYKLPSLRREGRAYRHALSDDGMFVLHEWALDEKDDVHDLPLVKEANPASWQTLERLRGRHDSPSTLSWQWKRFACGIWVRGYEQWIQVERWEACDADHQTPPRAREIPRSAEVVLAFDGSYNGDSTAIIAVTIPAPLEGEALAAAMERATAAGIEFPELLLREAPHIQVVECWEKPDGDDAPDDWSVPIEDVEEAIRRACKRWTVREIAADPYRWARSLQILTKERLPVVEFTQRPALMVPATTRFFQAVQNVLTTHDGDPRLARHIGNAVLHVSEAGGQIRKPSKTSPLVIDLAVCAVMGLTRAHAYQPRNPGVIDLNEVMRSMREDGEFDDDDTAEDGGTIADPAAGLNPVGSAGPVDMVIETDNPNAIDVLVRPVGGHIIFSEGEYVEHTEGTYLLRLLAGRPDVIAAEIAARRLGRALGTLPIKPTIGGP